MKKFIFLLAFFSSHANALTLANLLTEVRNNIKDNPADVTRQRYTDAVLIPYINEAQKDVVSLTGLSVKTTSYVLSPLTTYYVLPSDFINVTQVYFRNSAVQTINLMEFSQKSLYQTYPSWETSNTGANPNYYWISHSTNPSQPFTFTPRISYIPIPNSQSTGTITMWYNNRVADLSATTDVPFDNRQELYQYHMALAYHATMRLKWIEGKFDEIPMYQTFYVQYINTIKSILGQMPNYNPSFGAGSKE